MSIMKRGEGVMREMERDWKYAQGEWDPFATRPFPCSWVRVPSHATESQKRAISESSSLLPGLFSGHRE